SSRRRHTISKRDWSSDVCSSDLVWLGTSEVRLLVEGNKFTNVMQPAYFTGNAGSEPMDVVITDNVAEGIEHWLFESAPKGINLRGNTVVEHSHPYGVTFNVGPHPSYYSLDSMTGLSQNNNGLRVLFLVSDNETHCYPKVNNQCPEL